MYTFKNKLTICIDIDDTIINLLESWIKYLNERYKFNRQLCEIDSWDITSFFPGLSREQVYEPLTQDDFWITVQPKQEAIDIINKLIENGQEIYLCTATDYRNVAIKYEKIIKKYFPCIDWKHVIICANKQMINCDVMIDDGPHNLIDGNYYKILYTMPHNKNFDVNNCADMVRCKDWKSIFTCLKAIDYLKIKNTIV